MGKGHSKDSSRDAHQHAVCTRKRVFFRSGTCKSSSATPSVANVPASSTTTFAASQNTLGTTESLTSSQLTSEDSVQCLIYKGQNRNMRTCALCLHEIDTNNEIKIQLEAHGDICFVRKKKSPASALSDDGVESKLPYCAKCPYTFFCNFCDEIIAKIEKDFTLANACALRSGRTKRHAFCPHCCWKAKDIATKELRVLAMRLGWPDEDTATLEDWDMCVNDGGDASPKNDDEDTAGEETPDDSRKHRKIVNAKDLIKAVETHPEEGMPWFKLGAAIFPTQKVVVMGAERDKVDCIVAAVERNPNCTKYLSELILHCPKTRSFVVRGETRTVIDMAVRIVELNPHSATAWRNLGFLMNCEQVVHVMGTTMHRRDALRKSCEFATSDIEIAATAYAMGGDTGLLPFDGRDCDRREILQTFIDNIAPEMSLREAAKIVMGDAFVTQVLCELSLMFPDHPRVVAYCSEYEVDETQVLGAGAYGQVFVAHHTDPATNTRTKLAAKRVRYAPGMPSINRVQEMTLMTCYRFQNYITRCFFIRFDPAKEQATMFLEFAEHGSISHAMAAQGHRFHERIVRIIFQQLLEALVMLHDFSVVHQDLKPANALAFSEGKVKLADFGVSCNLCCKAVLGGTQSYMPPEALQCGIVHVANDIWSLGVTIVEIASGTSSVPDPEHMADPNAEPPFRPFVPEHLSPALRQLLRRCFEVDYTKRITAREALDDEYFAFGPSVFASMEPDDVFEKSKGTSGIPQTVLTGSNYSGGTPQGLTDAATLRADMTFSRGE